MSRRLKIAVRLHAGADEDSGGQTEQARYAERLGLDGIFVGDHLKPARATHASVSLRRWQTTACRAKGKRDAGDQGSCKAWEAVPTV